MRFFNSAKREKGVVYGANMSEHLKYILGAPFHQLKRRHYLEKKKTMPLNHDKHNI